MDDACEVLRKQDSLDALLGSHSPDQSGCNLFVVQETGAHVHGI